MRARNVAVGALAVLAAAQLVPVRRTNPPVVAEVGAPPEVLALLRRACWDCHSNDTVWGWHTYVAPISWLVAHDVSEGREHLNFSAWGMLEPRREAKLHREIPNEVGEGEMPPWLYVLAHPAARLTEAERAAIAAWGRTLTRAAPTDPDVAVEPAAASGGDPGAAAEQAEREHERRRRGGER